MGLRVIITSNAIIQVLQLMLRFKNSASTESALLVTREFPTISVKLADCSGIFCKSAICLSISYSILRTANARAYIGVHAYKPITSLVDHFTIKSVRKL